MIQPIAQFGDGLRGRSERVDTGVGNLGAAEIATCQLFRQNLRNEALHIATASAERPVRDDVEIVLLHEFFNLGDRFGDALVGAAKGNLRDLERRSLLVERREPARAAVRGIHDQNPRARRGAPHDSMEERRTEERERFVERRVDVIAPNLLFKERRDVDVERGRDDRREKSGIRAIFQRQTLRRDLQRRAFVVFERRGERLEGDPATDRKDLVTAQFAQSERSVDEVRVETVERVRPRVVAGLLRRFVGGLLRFVDGVGFRRFGRKRWMESP